MSSLIERAAQRLEQLRSTGVDLQLGPTPPVPGQVLHEGRQSKKVEIDLDLLAKNGFVTSASLRTRIAEEFRIIKRPLIVNASKPQGSEGARRNLIMVTSALPGEGKTFTAINLAMSMAAELDHTVMLVDADVRRPSMLSTLGLPPAPGLMEVVKSSVELPDVMLKTNVNRLSLLPSGMPHDQATELLASDGMQRLLDEIATRYADRIVIFDSPPLLLTTESRVLASRMGQIVFVVRAEETPQAVVESALATVEGCPVFLVLNQVRVGGLPGLRQGDGYGYDYGYGYGNGRQVR